MARSLVEMLHARATQSRNDCEPNSHVREHCYHRAAKLAAPYEARRLALERAFADAKTAQGRHGLVTAWRLLEEALATVPEIPEES